MSRDPLRNRAENADELRRHLTELANLYDAAKALAAARDLDDIAACAVPCGMSALGVGSGAMYMADERGRYRLIFARTEEPPPDSLAVSARAREWMLRTGIFDMGPTTARGIGALRDELKRGCHADIGVALDDEDGLAGFIVFGPPLLPGDFEESDLTYLESFGALTARALAARSRAAARSAAPRPSRTARSIHAVRNANPSLNLMIGSSPVLLDTFQDLIDVAETRFPALLMGESGVGKELAARAIHEMSERGEGPFEIVDCGSIPRELIESELFGHVRGSFTGAHRDRRGAFELAHHGTLFLDEIGEMPMQLQTRLLRVLQEGRFRRVGDERPIEVDVRVVAATNRDLRAEVDARRFREDLYYRLNVFAIHIPPLRERREDVLLLMEHFLATQGSELGVREWVVNPEVVEALERYRWPGNIRELGNLCASLSVRCRRRGEITMADLDAVWRRQHGGEDPPWLGEAAPARGRVGDWVLEQVRASHFNLVEAAVALKRRKRAGQRIPLTERSALAYYLTGEILRALVDCGGDADEAARMLAGDENLTRRVAPRVRKVVEGLRAADGDPRALRRAFAKLPADYDLLIERAAKTLR